MAASERLVVTFDDRSPTTNEATPPSFLVTELAGELEELVGRTAVSDLVSSHPLAPFDEANFLGGASFDRVALRGAIARRVERFGPDSLEGTTEPDHSGALVVARRGMLVGGRSVVPAAVEAPFAAPAAIGLDALGEAVVQPLRIFAREGLDASFPAREEELSDALAISVAPLGAWATVTQAANELLLGNGDASTMASARESGVLPLGLIGQAEAARFRTASHLLASGVVWALSNPDSDGRLSSLSREEVAVEVRLPATEVAADRAEGLAILGSCRGFLTPSTFWLVSVRYSRNVCAEVLRLWVQLLALGAQGTPAAAVISSLAPGSKTDGRAAIDTLVTSLRVGLDADECASHLGWLVDRYLRACRQPVVFTPRTGVALATKGSGAAAAEWDPSFGPALGERRQLAVQAAIGDLDFDTLIETTEFAAEATDLWGRVEASCEIVEAEPSFEHSSSSDFKFIEADR
jgi:exonuclease V gamma subunit